MALSLSETHRRRVERLVAGVKAYARAAQIEEKTASRRIFDDGKELERLSTTGSTKPATLEKYERKLAERKAALKAEKAQVNAETSA